MSKLLYLGGLVLAAAAGAAAGWYAAKEQYERIAREDFLARQEKDRRMDQETAQKKQEAQTAVQNYGGESEPVLEQKDIFVVSPDEFGDDETYTVVDWTFYAGDGVMADENDRPVKRAEEVIGQALNSFGLYAKDIVQVRNDKLRMYIEIVRDLRPYSEVAEDLPYRPEEDE